MRINSGADDPAGLIAAQALGTDITNTQQAVTNSQTASQMISTADSALGQISSLLNTVQGLITQAAQTGTETTSQISANQSQIDSALDAIDQIAETTTFQGQNLLNGSLAFTTAAGSGAAGVNYTNDATNLQINQADLGTTGNMSVAVNVTGAATQASLSSAVSTGAEAAVSGFSVTGGTNDLVFTAPVGPAYNGFTVAFGAASATVATPTAAYDSHTNTLTITPGKTTNTKAAMNTALGSTEFFDNGVDTGKTASFSMADSATTGAADLALAVGGAALTADPTTSSNNVAGTLANAVSFQITGALGSQVFSFQAGANAATMAQTINEYTAGTGVVADGTTTPNTLALTSQGYGSAANVNVSILSGSLDNSFENAASQVTNSSTGKDIAGTINGVTAQGNGTTLSLDNPTLSMNLTVASTTAANTQMAFNITGGGATFQIGPTVDTLEQARLGIQSMATTQLVASTGGRLSDIASGGADSLTATNGPANAAQIVNDVANQVTSLRGRLGAFQSETLNSNISSLDDAVTNLTSAQSSIQDADFAAESAALTRAQVLVQSGTAVLSIANHAPQNVLALLQNGG